MKWPSLRKQPALEASHGKGYKTESNKGKSDVSYDFGTGDVKRLPHPNNMAQYEDWGKDAESAVALEVLTNITAGVGYYTEMPEEYQPKSPDEKPHKNKQFIDDYGENINLDEKLQTITHVRFHKGFCPVEIIEDFDLKILSPETFYIYTDKKGNIKKYTQERSVNDVIAEWKTPNDMADILLFTRGWTPNRPYGLSLMEPIGELLDARKQMNMDMPKAVHRWAYPIPIMETRGPKAELQKSCEERDVDDWIFVGNVQEGDVRWNTLAIDPQARFIPYIELIYYQICEGLHAPLLLYLKNATEASATVMMESVDRLVTGEQRYLKRRVEKFLFKPQVGEPTPKLVWGQPQTGLEEMTMEDISAIMPFMAKNQQQHLLKQYIGGLPEPEWDKDAVMPQLQPPFQQRKPVEILVEAMIEKLNDLQTNLNIIEANHSANKINLIEACKLADRTISAYMKRVYPEEWEQRRDEKYQEFLHEKLKPKASGKKAYTVLID